MQSIAHRFGIYCPIGRGQIFHDPPCISIFSAAGRQTVFFSGFQLRVFNFFNLKAQEVCLSSSALIVCIKLA